MDDNNDGYINLWELSKAFKDFKIQLDQDELQSLFENQANHDNREIDIDRLINSILGKMPQNRRDVVEETFEALDRESTGGITINTFRQSYNGKTHPDVKRNSKSNEEVQGDFFELFEGFLSSTQGSKTGLISRNLFADFFNQISILIKTDEDFYSIVRCCRGNVPLTERRLITNERQMSTTSELPKEEKSEVNIEYPRYSKPSQTRFTTLAPYGIGKEAFYKTTYSDFKYPDQYKVVEFTDKNRFAAGVTSWPGTHYVDPRKLELETKYQKTLSSIAKVLGLRGVRGYLEFLQAFQNQDQECSGLVSFQTLQKGMISLF